MIDYTKNLKGWHYYRKKEYNSSITPKAVALWNSTKKNRFETWESI